MSDASNNATVSEGFGWDDVVEESEFEVIPEGDYWFTVTAFERAFYEPGPESKIGPCNQANIEFTIEWTRDDGETVSTKVVNKLKLTQKLAFLIYQFFESIGLKKKGDGASVMPWNQIIGKTGICAITHFKGRNGEGHQIGKCYPTDMAPTVTKNSKPGSAGAGKAQGGGEPQFEL